jgi:Zn-dependent protease with chaperone function
MATLVACSVLAGWLAGAVVVVRLIHTRAWRIEAGPFDPAGQAYRLHRLVGASVAITGTYATLGVGVVVATCVAVSDSAGQWTASAVAVGGMIACVTPMVASVRVIRRAYARVSDASIRTHGAWWVAVLAVTTGALVTVGVLVGRAVFPRYGLGHVVGMLLVYLLVLVAVQVLVAPLTLLSLRARPLPPETRQRLRRLAARMGVRVRDIRAIPGRANRLANAAQIGAVPGLRYIVISDYLLDRLDPAEVDAVVAHELGHVRGHHLGLRLLTVFGVWAALEAALVTTTAHEGTTPALLMLVPVLVAFPLGLIAVQGIAGVRFEHRADDAAARAVGGARLVAALEAIGRLNERPTDPGRAWSMLTSHPGLEDRLRRLRGRNPATTSEAVGAQR